MNDSEMKLQVPGTDIWLCPGYIVKLHRFDVTSWIVGFGWYEFSGNRPFCGWYLKNAESGTIKPLQLPDLSDIYIIEFAEEE